MTSARCTCGHERLEHYDQPDFQGMKLNDGRPCGQCPSDDPNRCRAFTPEPPRSKPEASPRELDVMGEGDTGSGNARAVREGADDSACTPSGEAPLSPSPEPLDLPAMQERALSLRRRVARTVGQNATLAAGHVTNAYTDVLDLIAECRRLREENAKREIAASEQCARTNDNSDRAIKADARVAELEAENEQLRGAHGLRVQECERRKVNEDFLQGRWDRAEARVAVLREALMDVRDIAARTTEFPAEHAVEIARRALSQDSR